MADQQEWPTERLRELDRAVAEARGWRPDVGYCTPDGKASWLAPVSLGTRETFQLMEEAEINVECMSPRGESREWWANAVGSVRCERAPTPAIAVCLAYLASKGRAFNG